MNNQQRPIIAVGDLVWDVLTRPANQLLPGGDTTGRIALAPGGSAANLATWVARAGTPAGFIGKVGADTLGDLLIADLEREGVNAHIQRDPAYDTGVILVMIDQNGQRSMVTNQGADFHLQPAELPIDALRSAVHVHITAWSLFTDPPRTAAINAAQIAKASGASISFDPASYQMISEIGYSEFRTTTAALPVDILFPNRDEGRVLTGETRPKSIARALRQRYPGALVVLKLDKDGCYIIGDDHEQQYTAPDVEVIDATGAGDAFDGAFIARYMRNGDIAAAAQFANAVGAWVVSRYGARPPIDAALAAVLAG